MLCCARAGEFPRQVWFSIKRYGVRELCEQLPLPLPVPLANGSPKNGLVHHDHQHENSNSNSKENGLVNSNANGLVRANGVGQRSASAWVLKSDEALSEWLQAVWARKEALLYATYAALGLHREHEMPREWSARAEVVEPWWVSAWYVFYLVYWSGFLALAAYLVLHSRAFDYYLLGASVAYVLVTLVLGGTDKLQIYRCNPRFKTAEVPERVLAHLPGDDDGDEDQDENANAAQDHKLLENHNQNHKLAPAPVPMPVPSPELQKGLNANREDTERALRLRELHVAQQ